MSDTGDPGRALLDCGVAARPLPGQRVSGDAHVLAPFPGGVLVAVIDGLGHGEHAATAALAAATTVTAHAGEPIEAIVGHCHAGLRGTRGVAMTLASFAEPGGTMRWVGVGNVEGVLVRAHPDAGRETVMLRGGVIGYQVPRSRPAELPVSPRDVLIMATDGIRHGFAQSVDPLQPATDTARRILAGFARQSDDALVLVARYLGADR